MREIGNEARQVTGRWLNNRSAALTEWRQMLAEAGRSAVFGDSVTLV